VTTVGELYVGLGVKGAEKSVGAITGVKDGLGKTKEMALETKAAIIGAIFAFERMFAGAMNTGAALGKFSTLTGQSSEQLERYQGAARNVNVSNESVTNSFMKLQSVMSDVLYTGQGPQGLNIVMSEMNLGPESIEKFMRAPDQFIQQLQKWAQLHKKDPALVRKILGGIGLDNDFITSLQNNAYTPAALAAAPVHDEKTVKALSESKALMSNMGAGFEISMDKISAKHLPELLKQLKPVVEQLTKMIEAFAQMSEKAKLLQVIGTIFEGWGHIFEGVMSAVKGLNSLMDRMGTPGALKVETSAGSVSSEKEARELAKEKGLDPEKVLSEFRSRLPAAKAARDKEAAEPGVLDKVEGALLPIMGKFMGIQSYPGEESIEPVKAKDRVGSHPTPPPPVAPVHTSSNTTKQMNFHQTNNIHGATPEAARSLASNSQKAVKSAFLGMSSRSQGA